MKCRFLLLAVRSSKGGGVPYGVQGKDGALPTRGKIGGIDFCLTAAFPLCCRYTVVNEINKANLGEASVFVYFIMKLSRVEGGTSYVGFHGGGFGHLSFLALQLASEQRFSNFPFILMLKTWNQHVLQLI